MTHTFYIETDHGMFTAGFSRQGLAQLAFPTEAPAAMRTPSVHPKFGPELRPWLRLTRQALERAFAGKRPNGLPPFDLSAGTVFQKMVWEALGLIPPGKTWTYSRVAETIGHPQARRAVGQACGKNPIPILIPCHRVVAAHGGLGGFSCGLKWKSLLLAREGVLAEEDWFRLET